MRSCPSFYRHTRYYRPHTALMYYRPAAYHNASARALMAPFTFSCRSAPAGHKRGRKRQRSFTTRSAGKTITASHRGYKAARSASALFNKISATLIADKGSTSARGGSGSGSEKSPSEPPEPDEDFPDEGEKQRQAAVARDAASDWLGWVWMGLARRATEHVDHAVSVRVPGEAWRRRDWA